jgi:hypothetical protein
MGRRRVLCIPPKFVISTEGAFFAPQRRDLQLLLPCLSVISEAGWEGNLLCSS